MSTQAALSPPQTKRLCYSETDLDHAGVLSRKTRWRLRREGKFPAPRQIGGRQLYVAEEIHEFLADPAGWAARQEAEAAP